MSVIELAEYRDSTVQLAPHDLAFLQRVAARRLRISRPLQGDGYVVNPQQFVGVLQLPSGALIRSTPKVPIANLVRMLAEALDLPELFDEHVAYDSVDELLELTARHFAHLARRIVESGMHRAYVEQADNLRALRGRIDFSEDLRANFALRHRVFCRFEEFTWDVPENQVIRQVLRLLSVQPHFSRLLRNDLRSLDQLMGDVTVGRFTPADVTHFSYHRFNDHYRPVHQLCRLFLEGASLSEELGSIDGRAFLVDMNALFERFVTRILQARVPAPIAVRAQLKTHLDQDRLIPIRPDLAFEHSGHVLLVADCKYKAATDEFRNSDVYQVLAYCTALHCTQGLLIYPASELSGPGERVTIRGSNVSVQQVRIDLSAQGTGWDAELRDFCARMALLSADEALTSAVAGP